MVDNDISKKKILHLINDFSSPFYANLFDSFHNYRIQHFIFSTYTRKRYKKLDRSIAISHEIEHLYFPHRVIKLLLFFKIVYVVRIKKIDVIHINNGNIDGLFALLIQTLLKVPFIITLRNTDINTESRTRKHLLKLVLKKSKVIILKSPAFKSRLDETTQSKIQIIPNGIDDFWLNNIQKQPRNTSHKEPFKIITVADFYCNKNIDKVVEAVGKLLDEGLEIRLVIVGRKNGDCKDLFSKIIQQNQSFVEYTGELSKKDLIEEYRKSNIFCLISRYETFGLVYLEALSQGLPIIYTKNQGVDGLVDDRYSIAVNIDEDNLTEVIKSCLNSSFELPEKSFFNRFSWHSVAKELEKIYLDI